MDNNIIVQKALLNQVLYYKTSPVCTYEIEYPQFVSSRFSMAVFRLNLYYRTQALLYQNECRTRLYNEALKQYKLSVDNGWPVFIYQAIRQYTITYNQNCCLSLYTDQYEFTGGAHGNTVRWSDNWNLQSGRRITLQEIMEDKPDYQDDIMESIVKQMEQQNKEEPGKYFDDYEQNVRDNFKEENFYLTNDGIVIFFQLYEIAPYVTGIPTFLIPYKKGKINRPVCQ